MTIRLREVEVVFSGADVFHTPLTLHLEPGTLTAVTGSSGTGKTTLLEVLGGHRSPSAGTVTGLRDAADIQWVRQTNEIVLTLTALENVALPLLSNGSSGPTAITTAREALASVGLEDFADHMADELSGGQQQRVAVARALAAPAQLILADEPTSALDAGNRRRILHLLHQRAATGTIVVITTNDPDTLTDASSVLHLEARMTDSRPEGIDQEISSD